MKTLETARLTLRKFAPEDFAAVHSYAASSENTLFMQWGPNTEEETASFIRTAILKAEEAPCQNYQYAAVHRESGVLIGACNLDTSADAPEIGWILHRNFWRQGYGAEMGKALLGFGFAGLGLHRIVARCAAENHASFRLMGKIGMRREGLFLDARPGSKTPGRLYDDELLYALTKEEWEVEKEIAYYNGLPCLFNGFMELPELYDGALRLVCVAKTPAQPEKNWVPAYRFAICKGSEKVGFIDLRIGYAGGENNKSLYYGGQIGYGIEEAHRGNGYALSACRLLAPVAKAHGMEKLLITNNVTNAPSRRVCEKLGARLLRTARLPQWHDLYNEGTRFTNIFEWSNF